MFCVDLNKISEVIRLLVMTIFLCFTLCQDVNFFHKKLHLNTLLGSENASGFTVFNYFHQKLHLRSLRGQICLCMYLVLQIWRLINEISKVGYEEIQKNV